MGIARYPVPPLLNVSQGVYIRWLRRKAASHLIRDRKRGNILASGQSYRLAIHKAVIESDGRDHYTGEVLDWSLISTYNNDAAQLDRLGYKAGLALLPSVDHYNGGLCGGDFRICAWRTNDAKSDLSHAEFVALCQRVVDHEKSVALGETA